MREFASMVKRHTEVVLNYFRARVTNASVEGMNRKAKAIYHRAYGYKSIPTFRWPCIMNQGTFRCRKPPTNSYEELESCEELTFYRCPTLQLRGIDESALK